VKPETLQIVTLVLAIVGALVGVAGLVLGIVNTWHQLSQRRVRLKLVPAHAIPINLDERLRFSIAVTNFSAFPVTVNEVGVLYHGTDVRGAMIPVLLDNGPWPRRLESRSTVSLYGPLPESTRDHRIRCAYARTDCGHTIKGDSPAMQQIAAARAPA
jgi:hypothetical protein